MPSSYSFQITRWKDKAVVEKVRGLDSLKVAFESLTYTPFMGNDGQTNNLTGDTSLQGILDCDTIAIRNFTFVFQGNIRVSIGRPVGQNNHLTGSFDSFQLSYPEQQPARIDAAACARIISQARNLFGAVDEKQITEALGEDYKRYFESRDADLQHLQDIAGQFISRLQEFTTKNLEDHQTKQAELDQEYVKKKQQLDALDAERQKALAEQVQALDKRLKEVNDKDSKFERRRNTERQLSALEERFKEFTLTKGTRGLRLIVHIFSVVLLLLFASVAVVFAVLDYENRKELNPWIIAREISFTVAFGATAAFYIRYNTSWFKRHADEEFKHKRMYLDVARANWLVEMGLEWKKETGAELPRELLEHLSRNLFGEDKESEPDLSPADALASAILGTAATVTLKTPVGDVTLDKKALHELEKKGK